MAGVLLGEQTDGDLGKEDDRIQQEALHCLSGPAKELGRSSLHPLVLC